MDWTRIGRFQQARPTLPSTGPRDEDAFFGTDDGFGILELLSNSGLFDHVAFGTDVSTNRATRSSSRSVTVIPGVASQSPDGSHGVFRRVVQYRVEIEVLDGWTASAWGSLDRLRSAAMAVLLDEHNRSYGGFCLPWESRLDADRFSSARVPGKARSLSGSFAYLVNTASGDAGL